jgi:hypothetical protein
MNYLPLLVFTLPEGLPAVGAPVSFSVCSDFGASPVPPVSVLMSFGLVTACLTSVPP